MTTVPQLEACLAEISLDIERQQEVLRGLERSKSFIQQQLNALRDPVASLPLELSSEIFLQCLPKHKPQPGALEVPMLLLNVCTAWTNIALSVPALWDTIVVHFPRAPGFKELLDRWLQRGHSRPLHISLRGLIDPGVAARMWHYSAFIADLDISFKKKEVPRDHMHHLLPLGAMPQAPLPCLQTLHIRGAYSVECSWLPLLQFLRLSPNLVDLRIQKTSFGDMEDVDEDLVLPSLRQLEYTGGSLEGSTLCWLSAPSLETLTLSPFIFEGTEPDDIVSFLQRSSPSLRELKVSCRHIQQDLDWLETCITTPPMATVSHLELDSPMPSTLDQLCLILEQSPSSVLPVLQTLNIRGVDLDPDFYPASHWRKLARVLTIRRAQLRTVRVILADDNWPVSQEVLSLFAGHFEDGMQIYIGTDGNRGKNLLLPNV